VRYNAGVSDWKYQGWAFWLGILRASAITAAALWIMYAALSFSLGK
jgi:hypothetical protein